jgi:iron(III) transport system substrate-binding protein
MGKFNAALKLVVVRAAMVAAMIAGLLPYADAQETTTLVVYSAVEPDEAKPWREAFERDNPSIKLELIRSSSGSMEARILAEKDNPRHDVIWRLANTSFMEFTKLGLLEAYTPKGIERIDPRFREKGNVTHWVGHSAYTSALCFNTVEAAKHNIRKPEKYEDLLSPAYANNIASPNPSASGTGFINIMAWIKIWGEDRTFTYMDALHNNIKFYLDSGSSPCQKAASGEVIAALSWDVRSVDLKTKGAPIEVIFFQEGLGWDLQGSAIRKGTPKLEAAKKFMDWVISDSAMRLYAQNYHVLAIQSFEKPNPNYPPNFSKLVSNYDFEFNSENRQRILKKWLDRYGNKLEKK